MARVSFGRRRIIILVILTSIILITLDERGNAFVDSARRVTADVMSPLQNVGRAVQRPIDNAWDGISNYDKLRKENEQLRLENEQERGNVAGYLSILNDYQELLQTNELPWLNQYQRVAAQVLGPVTNDFEVAIEINQGRTHGIHEGMPVVCGAGLVGKITKAFDTTSVVLLLTDRTYAVAAKVSSVPGGTGIPGVTTTTIANAPPASGTAAPDTTTPDSSGAPSSSTPTTKALGPSKSLAPNPTTTTSVAPDTTVPSSTPTSFPALPGSTIDPSTLHQIELGGLQGNGATALPTLDYISADPAAATIQVGDVVSTSGGATANGSSLAPPGLPIGVITSKTDRPGVSGPKLEVTPLCDLTHLSLLRVVLYVPTVGS